MTAHASEPQLPADGLSSDDDLASRSIGASVSAEEFKQVFRGHPGGVAVITAWGPDGPVALTASSVASVSAEPPILIFSVSSASSAAPAILTADSIVVHFLDADDLGLAQTGATHGVDRFADADTWHRLPTGEPVYPGVRAWLRCAVVSRMEAGGSTIVAAQALQANVGRDIEPGHPGNALVYHNRTWHRLGDHSRLD
jgi:flavin reductase (DIM6/NTAB) family NADH-FMN oxidoreductase RutF